MRIIHTSDWHIGRYLNGYSLLQDQAYFLDWLFELLKEEKIDVLIIAGDIYNTAAPSGESVSLLDEFFSRVILELKKKVLIISGNHDSSQKLGFSSNILQKSGFLISTDIKDIKSVELFEEDFSIKFVLVPYINISIVKEVFKTQEISSLKEAFEIVKRSILDGIKKSDINIICLHGLFLDISKHKELKYCDSEISIGGCDMLDLNMFNEFHYIALGHLHGPQKSGSNGIYSGSPLKYSVSEADHKKRVVLIDIKDPDNINIKYIFVQPFRDLKVLSGSFKELLNLKTNDFISVNLTDKNFLLDPYSRLKENIPNILELKYVNLELKFDQVFKAVRKKSADMLFEEFYKYVLGKDMNLLEKNLLNDVLKDIEKESC